MQALYIDSKRLLKNMVFRQSFFLGAACDKNKKTLDKPVSVC